VELLGREVVERSVETPLEIVPIDLCRGAHVAIPRR
jgi:hypothetical protein